MTNHEEESKNQSIYTGMSQRWYSKTYQEVLNMHNHSDLQLLVRNCPFFSELSLKIHYDFCVQALNVKNTNSLDLQKVWKCNSSFWTNRWCKWQYLVHIHQLTNVENKILWDVFMLKCHDAFTLESRERLIAFIHKLHVYDETGL